MLLLLVVGGAVVLLGIAGVVLFYLAGRDNEDQGP